MALVKCPECGKLRVSDSAVTCPDCGFGIKAYYDKIKYEEECKAQLTARMEEQKQLQEENEQRKRERKKRLFGSPVKITLWVVLGCVILALIVLVGIHIHKENEISDAITYSERRFEDLQESVTRLQNVLEEAYFITNRKPTLFDKDRINIINESVKDIDMYKRWVDDECAVDERVAISLDYTVRWNTSYQSWGEYKKFLTDNYLVSDTPEKSAEALIKSRTFSSYEEMREEKNKKRLFVESVDSSYEGDGYYRIYGKVTNNTSSTVRFVVVEILLKDENKKVFDTETTYACGDEGIRPGASAKYEIYYEDYSDELESFSASILSYD